MSGFGYNILGFGGGGPPPPEVDDEFNRVSFLSHFDGANNGVNNAFDDGSTSNHTCTAAGTATQGSFGPFARPEGEWAVHKKDGANYLAFPAITLTGIYTMQFWFFPLFNPASIPSPGHCMLYADLSINESGGGHYVAISSAQVQIQTGGDGDSLVNGDIGSSIKQGEWCHLLISRNSSNVYSIYINGVAMSLSNATQSASFGTNGTHKIGWGYNDTYNNAPFFISNFRITKTVEVTGNFTPSTTPLTAITDTKILTCQSNRFVDNSASALAITVVSASVAGAPAVSAFGPFLTDAAYDPAVNGASAFFDASASTGIIIADDLTDLQFGTGAFTIECWVYRPGGGGAAIFTTHRLGVNTGYYLRLGAKSDGETVHWGSYGNGNGNAEIAATATFSDNQWLHVAVVRVDTNTNGFKIYINGVALGTFTDPADYATTPYAPRVGSYDPGGNFGGNNIKAFICDLRILKGTALYTSNFTPPTAPLTAITNTKLLLNMADGQAIDSAAQNNLTLYGNANTSTDQAKFGDTSLHLDGTGDYVEMQYSSLFEMDAGAYTVECFIKTSGVTGEIVGAFNTASPYKGWLFGVGFGDGDGKLKVYNASASNAETVSSTAVVNNNAWRHVAFSKAGQTLKFFIDGDLDSTHTLDYVGVGSEQAIVIGASSNSTRDRFFNGYIDELRVTKATRYTADFTAPSEPFPDQGQV